MYDCIMVIINKFIMALTTTTSSTQLIKAFNKSDVRIQLDDKGEPWFNGKDACTVLGIKAYRDMFGNLDDDEKMASKIPDSTGRLQNATFVNESGLYELIFRSKHPDAKAFKKWVKTEVLPSIRKTGEYKMTKPIQYYEEKTKNIVIERNIKLHDFYNQQKDDRMMSLCRDNLNNIAMADHNVKMIEDKSKLISISERISNDMERALTSEERKLLIKLGKSVVMEYIKRNTNPPQQCLKFCNGQNTKVNCYTIMDYETWIDGFIMAYYKWQ